MYSDIKKQAEETITEIIALLNEASIKTMVDEPIDKVVKEFCYDVGRPVTHRKFHRLIEHFVRTIYEGGLNDFWRPLDPLAEALSLLEKHYQGTYAFGYSSARLDANDSMHGGVDSVLQRITESVKSIERAKYIQSVFARYINPCDWQLRCEIVDILLEYCRPFLPLQMLQCVPEQMVDDIPLLMNIHLNSENVIQQISFFHQK